MNIRGDCMSDMSPVGLVTTDLLLLPLSSANCSVYSYLPFCAPTYSGLRSEPFDRGTASRAGGVLGIPCTKSIQ
jgi:hypothetical protein